MSGGIYLRGENYYLDFTFHGKRIRQMYGPSRKGADKAIAKIKGEIAEGKFLDKRKELKPISFRDFAKQYLDWRGRERRRLSLMRRLSQEFESKTIQEITTWSIERYKAKRKEEVKPASVNREISLLKTMLTKAVEWGKLKENPAKPVKLLKGEARRVRFLMPDEIQNLLSNCADHLKPIVTVAAHTGMRRGEILGLTWDRVSFEQGIITLLDTKNSERRDVPMNQTVKAALGEVERKGPRVFSSGDMKTAFRTALKKAGIADFRFHDLRHTFASNLVMAGEDLNTVAELLGHKGLQMTKRYSHLSPKFKARAVGILDQVMSRNQPQKQAVGNVIPITR
jgi:integrase